MTTKNNIPAGYKDSAVGVIPQEWEVKRLGNIAKCFSGGTPKSESEEMYGGTIPFIRSGEIHSNKTALFLTDDGLRQSSAKMVDSFKITPFSAIRFCPQNTRSVVDSDAPALAQTYPAMSREDCPFTNSL